MASQGALAPILHLGDESQEEIWGENIMAAGPPSGGKTTQILTLPGKKFLYVFDQNCLQALQPHAKGQSLDYATFIPDIKEVDISVKSLRKDVFDKSGRRTKIEPRCYIEFEKDFIERQESGFFEAYDWLCFDGITMLSEMVMDRVQYLNERLGKQPEQGDWASQMTTLRSIFRVVTSLHCHTYTACHVEVRRDENTGKTGGQLVLTGRLRTQFPQRFTQIFGIDAELVGDKAVYTAQTVKDRDWPACRTNIVGLPPRIDVTIDFKKDPVGQGIGGVLLKAGLLEATQKKE